MLVRLETSPEDITGMKAAQGILTVRGGMTSHAAVVARGMGTCCVSGCGGEIQMDEANKRFTLGGKVFTEGSEISIDGSTGKIYEGLLPTADAVIAGEFSRIMAWADKYRRLKVRTNADTTDAKKARELGAEGIGLCRTEHMFFEEDRIAAFREMICADTAAEREAALDKILPYQQETLKHSLQRWKEIRSTSASLTRRCMSSLPTEEEDIRRLADAQGKNNRTDQTDHRLAA